VFPRAAVVTRPRPGWAVSAVMGLRERKKLDAWRTIRSTALRLISERGFDAVSADDIAAEAGVSRTTFFTYFPSKEAVVYDLDPSELQQWRALLEDPRDDLPLWDALSEIALGLARLLAERLPLQKRLFEQSPELCRSSRLALALVVAAVLISARKDDLPAEATMAA
jgi:AcrR family transcriptional regulator